MSGNKRRSESRVADSNRRPADYESSAPVRNLDLHGRPSEPAVALAPATCLVHTHRDVTWTAEWGWTCSRCGPIGSVAGIASLRRSNDHATLVAGDIQQAEALRRFANLLIKASMQHDVSGRALFASARSMPSALLSPPAPPKVLEKLAVRVSVLREAGCLWTAAELVALCTLHDNGAPAPVITALADAVVVDSWCDPHAHACHPVDRSYLSLRGYSELYLDDVKREHCRIVGAAPCCLCKALCAAEVPRG